KRTESYYERRSTFLKSGKTGKGTAKNFSLKNSSVIREFYLSKSISKIKKSDARYCDIAFFDLDTQDGLFLVIENKLFTTNHTRQLEGYYQAVEEKFHYAKVREYVYLSLNGDDPIDMDDNDSRKWIRISWLHDILGILESLNIDTDNTELHNFVVLLSSLKNIGNIKDTILVNDIRTYLLEATSQCMLEELNRLGEGKKGSWQIVKTGKRIAISHSSHSVKSLYIEILANLTVTIQSKKHGKAIFDKIILPLGANSDQIFNLFDIAARDIYHYSFGDNVDGYLGNKRRLTSTITEMKKNYLLFFKFIFNYSEIIKILFALSLMDSKPLNKKDE
ncbi:MAG: PD-(D/E)XK nuclease family protein, partial [Cyclobacteriaceae bacterium]